ncbi:MULTISPECIES: SagB family peptide dehydrogenase [unclassified Streptomyces]|uniref:SagB family peptide dehydrogenase n=2 Tax=Streptomyces TaxID=1883 RepID=A0ABU2RD30_9ACTN|nr:MULTISPECIES: SagB family peptide dehydrogenase [unclassified Streptomyces]AEN09635.1 SagB-type dehydrogenase domain protein [Streptomyces sp. SirexAA-E]MBK3594474.1 SagB family peptide dehydrogenase [Streptomyces sp. MBT51]MDT0426781.1 SagB family peptide dehydrogenase [Streptomyces sp. DSM 41770]MYR70122.1 SagB/ThcOx family dehydrogenase [Streptomyces sp. SID4939]MYS03859.1 SagB/ThcOx family dehydrogenase [Streptomyces sp. SID4940]
MNSVAPSLTSLWSLREDCGYRPVPGGPGAGVVSTPWEEIRLDPGTPAVARALERMTYGPVSLDNVLPGFTEGGGTAGDRAPYDALDAALGRLQHVVVRTLALAEGVHHLTVVPIARRARFRPGRPAADAVHRLSRFVTLRASAGGWVAESPLTAHRVVLHTPQAGWLVSCYARPTTVREAARLLGMPVAEAALTVGYLEAAGVLLPGKPLADGAGAPSFTEDEDEALAHWSPRELLVHQRSRPGSHDEPVGPAGRPGTGAGRPGPAGAAITLPVPPRGGADEGEPALSEVLAARRSERPDDGKPLSLDQLGELLHRSAAERPAGGRPYPSLGSRYPLELYLTVTGSGGLERGVYHYDPYGHLLFPLDPAPELVDDLLAEAAANAGLSQEPPVLITMTARFHRVAGSYAGTAYSALLKEVGALQQTLYLVATAMGLGPCALAFGDTETAAHAFGLDWRTEPGVGEFVVSASPGPAVEAVRR